jgi:hypothetical protein
VLYAAGAARFFNQTPPAHPPIRPSATHPQAVDMGWLASRGFQFLRCDSPGGALPPEMSELIFVFTAQADEVTGDGV